MLTLNSIIFFAIFQITISVDPCQTPNGQEGDCKPINLCPSIYNLFDGEITTYNRDVLRKSHCGFAGHYPKVCCPIGSYLPPPPTPEDMLPKPPDCGSQLDDKIWGGNQTSIDEFPWMVLLMYRKNGQFKPLCGGFLISKRYVLTARHCLQNSLMRVRLGEWDTRTNPDCIYTRYGEDCAPAFLDIPVEEQIPHEGPNNVLQNDIALLRLNQDVQFNDFVKPVCLPTSSDLAKPYSGEQLTVSGWGKTENSSSSDVKLKVQIPVVDLGTCEQALRRFGDPDLVSENPICAGGQRGKDSCTGDSGGPLVYKTRDWYAAGIVSFGVSNPCGQENAPSVYVRVASHIGWIISKMKP